MRKKYKKIRNFTLLRNLTVKHSDKFLYYILFYIKILLKFTYLYYILYVYGYPFPRNPKTGGSTPPHK